MQRFECMGDRLHKKSPPKISPEPVTPLFIKQVNAALLANLVYNTEQRLKKGDDSYRIATHSDLADAIDADKNLIKHMLGGVRSGTQTKAVGKSKYVALIRRVLKIPDVVTIEITRHSKTDLHVAPLNDEQMKRLDDLLSELARESRSNTR